MDKQEYRHVVEQICPPEGAKEKLWRQIAEKDGMTEKEKKCGYAKRRWVYRTAVLAVIFALVIPGAVFADEIRQFFSGIFTKEESVQNYVDENVFEDSDEHVKMQVVELLSDEVVLQMIVKYEALDEVGEKWLASGQAEHEGHDFVRLLPDFHENTVRYGINLGYACDELPEYRTKEERYYYVTCEATEWSSVMQSAILEYSMTCGKRSATMDVTANVPVYEFRLQADENNDLDLACEPSYIRVSALSYILWGKEQASHPDAGGDLIYGDKIERITLLGADGTTVQTERWGWGGRLEEGTQTLADAEGRYDSFLGSGGLSRMRQRTLDIEGMGVELDMDPAQLVGVRVYWEDGRTEYRFTDAASGDVK